MTQRHTNSLIKTSRTPVQPVTAEMLGCISWTDQQPSADSLAWRSRIEKLVRLLQDNLAYIGAIRWSGAIPPNLWINGTPDHLTNEHYDVLIEGLMKTSLSEKGLSTKAQFAQEHGNKSDQDDLARWLGQAMAFSHEHNNGRDSSGEPIDRSLGSLCLYQILDKLMGRVGAMACYGQDLPDWARKNTDFMAMIDFNEEYRYRPWDEVHEMISVFLTEFSEHTDQTIIPSWNTNIASQGCTFLRLVASVVPDRISDDLVEKVRWLKQNIRTKADKQDEYNLLDKRVQAQCDLNLLEKVGTDSESGAGTPPPPRRRVI